MLSDSRYRCPAAVAVLFLLLNLLTRLVFADLSGTGDVSLLAVLAGGVWNDALALVWIMLPLVALLFLPPWKPKAATVVSALLFSLCAGVFLFTAAAEYFFWDEFSARFNFVAVDYLIYTTEVLGNIRESYPVLPLLGGIGALALGGGLLFARQSRLPGLHLAAKQRIAIVAVAALAATGAFCLGQPLTVSSQPQAADLGHNGLYTLFSAYRNNQLDYQRFYASMDNGEAVDLLRTELGEPGVSFTSATHPLLRHVRQAGPEKRLNVIQIVVESLGTASLGEHTPELARLREQSLSFTNMLATGTRTVRGIEALTLSLPPTPGSSIVRRPGNEGLFTNGSLFRSRGYDTAFIYGGYGYFDNMNAYFEGNGFRTVDRAQMPKPTFANVWGVCDEDLYATALAEADANHAANRPFYQFVLTTSNHRPFTYPDGRVDLPSGSSRRGAVAYTDYAIGRFLREAATHPWFEDTIFVIVADHTAGSAGQTSLPPENYRIPCLVYSPAHVTPASVDILCSQIDVAPTLFALLGWSYDSLFFGKNILTMTEGRAYIGTYQLLGRLDTEQLVILEPRKPPRLELTASSVATTDAQRLYKNAMAPYQTVQALFSDGRLKDPVDQLHTASVSRDNE